MGGLVKCVITQQRQHVKSFVEVKEYIENVAVTAAAAAVRASKQEQERRTMTDDEGVYEEE